MRMRILASFYCYVNYHPTKDFVVNLDDIWKWLGYSQKVRAKEKLVRHFKKDKDYKASFPNEKAGLGENINKKTTFPRD